MSRLYFDCPIQAFYMMREFGVLFENKSQIIDGVNNMWQFGKKEISANYYVAKESEYIFEPKKGDKNERGLFFDGIHWTDGLIEAQAKDYTKIAFRNNKPFFTTLVEST